MYSVVVEWNGRDRVDTVPGERNQRECCPSWLQEPLFSHEVPWANLSLSVVFREAVCGAQSRDGGSSVAWWKVTGFEVREARI